MRIYTILAALAAICLIPSPVLAMGTKPQDQGTVPVSVANQQDWAVFQAKVQKTIFDKSGWNDPEYYHWNKSMNGIAQAIQKTNNAAFLTERATAEAIAERLCGRLGGCGITFPVAHSTLRD